MLFFNCETLGTRCAVVMVSRWCLRRKEGLLPTSTDVSLSILVLEADEVFNIFVVEDVALTVAQVTLQSFSTVSEEAGLSVDFLTSRLTEEALEVFLTTSVGAETVADLSPDTNEVPVASLTDSLVM